MAWYKPLGHGLAPLAPEPIGSSKCAEETPLLYHAEPFCVADSDDLLASGIQPEEVSVLKNIYCTPETHDRTALIVSLLRRSLWLWTQSHPWQFASGLHRSSWTIPLEACPFVSLLPSQAGCSQAAEP
eukprot:3021111-Prymnesium_polylepis.1